MKDLLKIKRLLNLFMDIMEVGERRYVATMETMDGDEFSVIVKAYNTAEALQKIEDYTVDGCKMNDIRIIDEDGNVF